jgi:CDP-diacylglycerol--serine O-phosphatidyltransferase
MFTMGNIVCGFFAIVSAFNGKITHACWFVVLAGFLDLLDGRVARLSGASSQFGVELDSLADFLSFGVAPAVITYVLKLDILGEWRWILSIVYLLTAAYRLARFNLLAGTEEKKDFLGLPVPSAALGLVSYIIFSYHVFGGLVTEEIFVTQLVLFSFLMVSQVNYDALPDKFDSSWDRIKLVLLIIAVVAVIFRPRLLLFPLIASYILSGMIIEGVRLFGSRVKRRSNSPVRTAKDDQNGSR